MTFTSIQRKKNIPSKIKALGLVSLDSQYLPPENFDLKKKKKLKRKEMLQHKVKD